MLGIFCKFECPSCGNVLNTQSPFWNKKMRKVGIAEPTRCGCGRKGSFKLLGFKECQYEIAKDAE